MAFHNKIFRSSVVFLQGVGGMFNLLSRGSFSLKENVTDVKQHQTNGSDDKIVTFYVQFSKRQRVSCRNSQLIKLEVTILQ